MMPERRAYITIMEYEIRRYEVPLGKDEQVHDAIERVTEASTHERYYEINHETLNDGDIVIDFEESDS